MSKDRSKTVEIPVKTVENWSRIIEYVTSTIMFWKLENKWPTNLIYDKLSDILNEIKHNLPSKSSFNTEIPF